MRSKYLILSLLISMGHISAQQVNVAAASNLRYVLEELKIVYLQQNPTTKLNLVFGSTGTLVQQITNGANFDFLMAADDDFPRKLVAMGFGTGAVSVYSYGKLAIYSTSLPVDKVGLEALKNNKLNKIAIAKPQIAPYGERAIQLLHDMKLYNNLKSKLVFAENISAAAQFCFTGNAELGFVALSLVLSPEMRGKGSYFIIPQNMYKPIAQACVLTKRAATNAEAAKFNKFVLSPANKEIWEKYGYTQPNAKP